MAGTADRANGAAAAAGTGGPNPEEFLARFTWEGWTPAETATLLFVIRDGRILLIEKHRGLGKGKINGPGGRLEPGETAGAAAIREVSEEILVRPTGARQLGELHFQFVSGYAIRVFVFRADGFEGEPGATSEATPVWFDLDRVPYDRMWEDDAIWLPLLLEERSFRGRFVFDGDRLIAHEMDPGPLPERRSPDSTSTP